MTDREQAPSWVINPHVPSVARMYDYYLGGKDNFAADREAAEQVLAIMPYVRDFTRDNRAFLSRSVRLIADAGVRQFLDIGSGLPTRENVHQVAQQTAPDSRVVYVDNDPIVLAHGRALLAENPLTTVVQADLREPKGILDHPEVAARIDFGQPVAVLLLAVLHFVADDDEAASIVARLRERLAPGSYLVISHGHAGRVSKEDEISVTSMYKATKAGNLTPRSADQILTYFEGLELLEPGLVPVEAWRPEYDLVPDWDKAGFLGGVGYLP